MRKSIIVVFALIGGISVSACNTIGGAGKDVSSVGKAVTKSANAVKN
jgi:predicted small secreted protein